MNLFVIGNYFDVVHNLPTRYSDFRGYLLRTFLGCDEYDDLVPESILLPDGDEKFDIADVAGYVSRIIDNCNGGNWSNLEYYLGNAVFDSFLDDLDPVSMDESDRETMRAVYRNEELSDGIKRSFVLVKKLFCDWVRDELGAFEYKPRADFKKVLDDGNAFLNFNYTLTLENAYGKTNVCHIHGVVGDDDANILFGHGDDDELPESLWSFGADVNLNSLKRKLRKDTQAAMEKNWQFFEGLKEVETIHSFGFGFADVDMIYIEEIARRAKGAIWYLNRYDADDAVKRQKLEDLGFKVDVDNRW